MASDTSLIAEQGVVTLPDAAWAQARQRADFIGPLAALDVVGHEAADAAAHALGLSRRQVYVLIRRARQGSGLVTDLVLGQSSGGKGQGRLPEPIERIIRDLPYPVLLTEGDSYQVASCVHDLNVKTRPADTEKIRVIRDVVSRHVDVEAILKLL